MDGHDCIVCPYHGWAFDMGGHLREVPASETSKDWPTKPLIESYHVEEKVTHTMEKMLHILSKPTIVACTEKHLQISFVILSQKVCM